MPTIDEMFYSNDWLIPVGERTKSVLLKYPQEKRLKIATLVAKEMMRDDPDIPSVFVFNNDDPDETLDRLLETLRTPAGGDRVIQDFDLELGVDDLRRIILDAGTADESLLESQAAQHMLKVAHGDPHVEFDIYRDYAREYPQYSEHWLKQLKKQFGEDFMNKTKRDHSEFFALIYKNIHLANYHYQEHRSMQHPEEDTANYLRRAFKTADEVGFDEMTRILVRGLLPFRKASYQLRGLEFSAG